MGDLSPVFKEEGLCVRAGLGGRGQRDLFAFALFSDSFRLRYSICQAAICWGSVS